MCPILSFGSFFFHFQVLSMIALYPCNIEWYTYYNLDHVPNITTLISHVKKKLSKQVFIKVADLNYGHTDFFKSNCDGVNFQKIYITWNFGSKLSQLSFRNLDCNFLYTFVTEHPFFRTLFSGCFHFYLYPSHWKT